jgi:hypothetical protein
MYLYIYIHICIHIYIGQREQREKALTDQIEALDSSNAQLTLEYSDRVTGI